MTMSRQTTSGPATGRSRSAALRGEVWIADLDPVRGRELGMKPRPVLILSSNAMNQGAFERVIVVPSTSVSHDIPCHVEWSTVRPIDRKRITSYFACEDIRSISVERLERRILSQVAAGVMANVQDWIRNLLDLH